MALQVAHPHSEALIFYTQRAALAVKAHSEYLAVILVLGEIRLVLRVTAARGLVEQQIYLGQMG